jgi:hypothetical protein
VRTGRHGESWELLFHPDRTFDKVRLSQPVKGTTITLFKSMDERRVEPFVQELRFVLSYWCEHSDTPITLRDETRDQPLPSVAENGDPFAAFATPLAMVRDSAVNRPLELDAALELRAEHPGIDLVIGYADPPRFGFYNGGLTLLNTQNSDVLGRHGPTLGHLSFKVKHDHLEHTLTRDNVLHDEHWERAMAAVLSAHGALRERLVERIEHVVPTVDDLDPWHARLADECVVPGAEAWREGLTSRALFRDQAGDAYTLDAIRSQEARLGAVLVTSGRPALDLALRDLGIRLVADRPNSRRLLLATEEPPLFDFLRNKRTIRAAHEVFVLPSLVERDALPPAERALVERTEELLRAAVGMRWRVPATNRVVRWSPRTDAITNRLRLLVGDFGGAEAGRTEVLALNGPGEGRVFIRPTQTWLRLPPFLHWRTLLLNRHHPLFRAQLLAAIEDLDLGAFGLASALLTIEGIEGERAFQRMLEIVAPALVRRRT